MSEPTPEPQARPTEPPASPGGGFAAADPWPAPPTYGAPGQLPPPPGYPAQPYPNQPAYPPSPGPQDYPTGYPAPAYAAPGATTPSIPGSTVVLLVLSVVGIVATGIIGIPSAVIAALAWRQNGADPVAARKRTTTGWIVFAVNFAVGILVLIPFYIWASDNS